MLMLPQEVLLTILAQAMGVVASAEDDAPATGPTSTPPCPSPWQQQQQPSVAPPPSASQQPSTACPTTTTASTTTVSTAAATSSTHEAQAWSAAASTTRSLRLVCHAWRGACDQLVARLRLRAWPAPVDLPRLFPAVQHVQLCQLRLVSPEEIGAASATTSGNTATRAPTCAAAPVPATAVGRRRTRSQGPPPPPLPAADSSTPPPALQAAQSLLRALAVLPRLRRLVVQQAWGGAVRGRAAHALVAAVVAGLPAALPRLQQVHLLGDGVVQPTAAVAQAMAAFASAQGAPEVNPPRLKQLVVSGTRLRRLPAPSGTSPSALSCVEEVAVPALPAAARSLLISPPHLAALSQLRRLDVRQCGLSALPADLGERVPHLAYLDVAGNALAALPTSLGALGASLRHLDASDNKLTTLPQVRCGFCCSEGGGPLPCGCCPRDTRCNAVGPGGAAGLCPPDHSGAPGPVQQLAAGRRGGAGRGAAQAHAAPHALRPVGAGRGGAEPEA